MTDSVGSTPRQQSEQERVAEKLRRHPAEVLADYWAFRNSGDLTALHRLTVAVLLDFSPQRGQSAATWTDESRLIEDIGFDSLAVAEMVFFFEDLFAISISNEEIMQVRTLGQLREFVGKKALTNR